MVTINIGRKEMVFFSVVVLVFVVAGLAIGAYSNPIPDNGHGGDNVLVNFNGTEMSLQSAIDLGGLGGGGMSFGDWESKSGDTPYEALTDGIVVASAARDDKSYVRGYIGDTSSSLIKMIFAGGWDISNVGSITMPVKKGKYWEVEARGSEVSIYWIPIISSGGGSGGGGSEGGPITTKDSDDTTMVKNKAYKAQVAGFISAKISTPFQSLDFYVGASANPVSTGNHMFHVQDQSWGNQGGTIFVPKDNYFEIKVVTAGTATIYWTPLILDGANPINQD